MDRKDCDLPQQAGTTRRQVLRVGATAGTLVWAVPAVQTLTMTAATAEQGSPICTAVATTNGVAENIRIQVGNASNAGTAATSEQTDVGGPDVGEVGSATPSLGPVSTTTDSARSESLVTAALATTTATSKVEEILVDTPAGLLVVRGILSTATATVTSAGAPSASSSSTVAFVQLGSQPPVEVPSGPGSVSLPPAPLPFAGLITLTFNQESVEPGTRAVTITRTALRIQVPSLGIDVVAGRTRAFASYPACP